MGELLTKFQAEMKASMKARDQVRLSVTRLLIDAIKKQQIDEQKDDIGPDAELAVVRKAVKTRKDSIEQATKLGRMDIADAEAKELAIIEAYLPQQLTGDALLAKVRELAQEIGYSGPKDIGRFMKEWMSRHKALADGKAVQDALKAL
jgi:uncharacterized protein YqeY